jgi:uncharacterized protein (UPF0335 family)
MSRYNRAKRENMQGLVTSSDHSRTMNQINHAVLSLCGSENSYQAPPQYNQPKTVVLGDVNERALLKIVVKNKRRLPEISQEAQAILNEYREYKDKKVISPAFDPINRRFKVLQQQANDLIERLNTEKEISVEQIVERIMKLVEADKPNYTDLKEAYTLASGRGFKNTWIEQQLLSQPNDNEVLFTIAEEIEFFVSTIFVS